MLVIVTFPVVASIYLLGIPVTIVLFGLDGLDGELFVVALWLVGAVRSRSSR